MSCNRITANTLHDAMLSHEACQILDVREPKEFASGHIEGSENISLTRLQDRLSTISLISPVYLVSKTGRLSDEALIVLASHGFQNVFVVAGGLLAWSSQGFPLKKRPVHKVRAKAILGAGLFVGPISLYMVSWEMQMAAIAALVAGAVLTAAWFALHRQK